MYQYKTSLYITPIEYRTIREWLHIQFPTVGDLSEIDNDTLKKLNEDFHYPFDFEFNREQDLSFFLMQWSNKYN